MKRLTKPNRISWAPVANLCQVNLSEDCPSKVGLEAQHHLQLKASWISHANGVNSDNHSSGCANPLKEKRSRIPQIKWNCPPKFGLDRNWRVAAGEESEEAVAQMHRLYTIPPSPSTLLDVEDCHYDDSNIPLIPISPIEEEKSADCPSEVAAPLHTSVNSRALDPPQGSLKSGCLGTPQSYPPVSLTPPTNDKTVLEIFPSLDADVVVAAAAAVTAVIKSEEPGSLIDTDLLIQILSDPKLTEKLISEHGAAVNTKNEPISVAKTGAPLFPLPSSKPNMVIKKSMNEHGAPAGNGSAPFSCPKTVAPFVLLPGSKPEVVIKKLTNEHGSSIGKSATPNSGSPLVSFPGSRPNEMLTKNWINEHGSYAHIGTAHVAGSKPVTPSAPLPSSKPDMVMFTRMINEYGAHDRTGNEPSFPGSKFINPSVSLSTPKPEMVVLPNVLQSSLHTKPHSPHTTPNPSPFSATVAPPVKDINYYKSLIEQHGERQETLHSHRCPEPVQNLISSESKTKNQKPCVYFNSSKGCRMGSSCPYQHSLWNQLRPDGVPEAPSAKRMKHGGVDYWKHTQHMGGFR